MRGRLGTTLHVNYNNDRLSPIKAAKDGPALSEGVLPGSMAILLRKLYSTEIVTEGTPNMFTRALYSHQVNCKLPKCSSKRDLLKNRAHTCQENSLVLCTGQTDDKNTGTNHRVLCDMMPFIPTPPIPPRGPGPPPPWSRTGDSSTASQGCAGDQASVRTESAGPGPRGSAAHTQYQQAL